MADAAVETYARSLFDLASAAGAVDAADEGLQAVLKAVRGHADLREALTDAVMPAEKKREIVRGVFGETVVPEVLAMVTLLSERGRLAILGDVAATFSAIAEKERNIVVAEVTTAVPLTDAVRASLTDKLSKSLGRPVTLRERVDGTILGGIVIKVAGRLLDGSLASQLDSLRLALAQSGGEA